ncbi:MAG TPA: RNA polymerase sigma factor [Acidimicrobiia bacterium]|nr:RNA polymerase sigma factor [Acidimicrobiia bacterium]
MDSDAKAYQELRFELTRLATALVGPSEAEDVVADVVVRVLERPGGLSGLKDPRPYLVKAIINEARSRFRKRKRVDDRPVRNEEDPPAADYRDQLVEVVSTLPPRQRAATFLVYWEGHTSVSAAELMGCRPATVRRYLHLAHRKLEEMIDER